MNTPAAYTKAPIHTFINQPTGRHIAARITHSTGKQTTVLVVLISLQGGMYACTHARGFNISLEY